MRHVKYKYTRKEKGVIIFSITQRCNNYCVFCYCPKLMINNPDIGELKKEIDIFRNPKEIYLSGGEPTIRKDFFEIIGYIKKKYPKVRLNLITNGRMLSYPSFVKRLKKTNFSKIVTEIHGPNSEIHDKITQVKGSFLQTVDGIKNLIKLDIPVELRIVINKINYKDLPALARFITTNFDKLTKVVLFPINIVGEAYKNKEKIAPRYKEIKPYVQKCVDILSKKQKVDLFHFPFCTLDKKYWGFITGPTTVEERLSLTKECKDCIKKENCPKIWKTYLHIFGKDEFKPIKK
ncbi:MAG: radical SAM protein [Nanoarchaeota archaeon]|nr:radical SAM protein [Nanoarchaeota archaeon]